MIISKVEVRESKHNPRGNFQAKAMEDLTGNIKTHSIPVPLQVELVADQIEIVVEDAFPQQGN
jgi:hypothetical protein